MDALEGYKSEEDEDYVPDDEAADDHYGHSARVHAVSGKSTKRKRGASAVELSAPKRVPMNTKAAKKKGATRIGAAVLSDDDDDLMPLPQSEPTVDERKDSNAQSQLHVKEEEKESEPHAGASGSINAAAEERKEYGSLSTTSTSPTSSVPSSTVPSSASTATSAMSATLPSSCVPPSPSPAHPPPSSTAGAAAQGSDLASILAQFNKKPTKPAVKKVINPWELPSKLKPVNPNSTASTSPAVTPSSSSPNTADTSTTASPSSPPSALSTEQVVVSDITSYAGETIQVTKTLIRGSAEEVAHRAATANNLTALLSSLTNQRTINTLEKSRLDWSVSKEEEGDADELKRFVGSKEGLVDRMAFLARTEQREWEKVKAVRDEGKKQTMVASTEGMDGD